jgi:capsular exopolysaccharide synthesis family protein
VEDYASKDPRIQQAANEITQEQHYLTELQKVMKNPNAPEIVRARDAINSVQKTIEELKNEVRQNVVNTLRRNNSSTGVAVQNMKVEKELLVNRLKEINAEMDTQAENIQKLVKFNGDADQLRSEIDHTKMTMATLMNELTLRNVELGADSRVQIAARAGTPMPVRPYQQAIATGVTGLFGFGLALLGVTFFEFLTRKLNASHELADGLGIRVMGDLPALRRRIGMRSRSRRAMHGLVAESINSIRATLVRNANPASSNVFLVTSAGESEGKTTVASQLAASLARGGRKTLLIDADLRHPGGHLVFGLPNEVGFSELLRGEMDVDEVIQPTPADNLWMITAGQCCATAVMAMGKEAVAQVLGRLEARFEFIVIDTGPVLKVADALLLGAHVDGAILSVLRDVSRIHKVYEANERLKLAGVKVVGAVVNGVEGRGSFDRYHVEMSAA